MDTQRRVVVTNENRPLGVPTPRGQQITYAVKNRAPRTVTITAQRESLIREHMVVVETIVGKLLRGRLAPNIEKGDLLSVGYEWAILTVDLFLTGKARGLPLAKCVARNCETAIKRFINKQHRTVAGALAAEGRLRVKPRSVPRLPCVDADLTEQESRRIPYPEIKTGSRTKGYEEEKLKRKFATVFAGYDEAVGPRRSKIHQSEITGRATSADWNYGTSLVYKERYFENGELSNGFTYQFFPLTKDLALIRTAVIFQCATNHPAHWAYLRAAKRNRDRGKLLYSEYPIKR